MSILANNEKNRRSQRGSVVIHVAIFLSVAVILFVGTELGYLFYLKREFQKAADLAALAGAQALNANNCAAAYGAAKSNANDSPNGNMPADFLLADSDMACGQWSAQDTTNANHFDENATEKNAMRVSITRTPSPLFIFFTGNRTISVQAIAARSLPKAVLNIRSTLVSVDSTQSALLNTVLGKFLGTSLAVTIGGWNGLLGANIKLLSFLDELAIVLDIAAGQYDQVLNADAKAGQLLQAMVNALRRDGSTADAAIEALEEIRIQADIPSAQPLLRLGDLLGVQTGTEAAGLQTDLQLFQLVQGIVQLANNKNGISADIPVTIPGLGSITTKLRVIQPPQISAIGNPELAKIAPDGPDRIQVQTAQLRTLISVDLPGLSGIVDLLNAVTKLLAPVTSLLNSVLSLDLKAILCLGCTQTQIVLPEGPIRLSINLNAASAKAKVIDVDCTAPNKELEIRATTAAAELRIGTISDGDAEALLADGTTPELREIPVMDVQTRNCTLFLCGPWSTYSRTGLRADTTVAATTQDHTYSDPPELDAQPIYYSMESQDIVKSLSDTLSGLQLQTHKYSASAPNGLGDLIGTATQLLGGTLTVVQDIIKSLLSPLLDSLVNLLLKGLGIQLAKADIGARLSCARGAELVF